MAPQGWDGGGAGDPSDKSRYRAIRRREHAAYHGHHLRLCDKKIAILRLSSYQPVSQRALLNGLACRPLSRR